ncbi:MAG: LLM class flavin-dependent oxidoreductase [Chloroflexi bacterium]|nr:LLM class flavin-dependent oxidoreductase [Chloroflexota bacterium]
MSQDRVVKVGGHFPWGSKLQMIAEFSQTAEASGLDSIWLTDKYTSWGEMWTTAVLVATNTKRIRIGLDGTDPYRRNVVITAHATATVDEISNGRMIFGMGGGHESLIERMGIEQTNKIAAMREGYAAIKGLLNGETVNIEGEAIKVRGAQLGIRPVQSKIPMMLIGTDVEQFKLAAEIADGVLIWGGGERYLTHVRDICYPVVEKRGMDPKDFQIIPWIPFSVSHDPNTASELLVSRLTEVVRRVPPESIEAMGLDQAEVAKLREAWESGDHEEAMSLLTDDIMQAWAIYGTPEVCTEKIRELPKYGVTEVMLQFTENWRDNMSLFRDEIAPGLNA